MANFQQLSLLIDSKYRTTSQFAFVVDFCDILCFSLSTFQDRQCHISKHKFIDEPPHPKTKNLHTGENKGTDQLYSNCTADQRLCFRNTVVQSLFLNPKISSGKHVRVITVDPLEPHFYIAKLRYAGTRIPIFLISRGCSFSQ